MALLGTASFLTIAGTAAAQTQGNAPPVEEVLVTGSLIRGGAAVGVPVTALSEQDFSETGSVTVSDMLKSLPAVSVQVGNPVNESGGRVLHDQNIQIHNVPSANANETLLMVDGQRFPFQGLGQCSVDPSIIPQLAVDRIDVLADGASATYGSDALAGVVNVILKHGYDGAISKVQYGRSTDIGGDTVDASQLFGRKWDTGSVDLTYDVTHVSAIHGPARDYFTGNYEPYGFEDNTPIGSSNPGVVSTGGLKTLANGAGLSAKVGTRFCANCFSIPSGTGWNYGDTAAHTNPTAPGSMPTTTWTALLANAGVKNEKNPDSFTDVLPSQDTSEAVLTFDQHLFDGLSVFAEAFYFNRRSTQHMTPGVSPIKYNLISAVPVPTTNPYYPAGAPAGLRVSYNLAYEVNGLMDAGEHGGRYEFGVNANLPYDWNGKIYYSMSRNDGYVTVIGTANNDAVSAALGNTVQGIAGNTSLAPLGTFTKPDNVPYLNPFCDATQFKCNSPTTLAYISAHHRDYNVNWIIGEGGADFDGPVVDLPGGTMKAAVGAVTYSDHTLYSQNFDVDTDTPNVVRDNITYTDWAVFAQTDIPVIGEMNKLPGVEALTVQLGIRHDDYNTFGSVTTPKVGAKWLVGWGLSLNADWGRAFRAPITGESSAVNGALDEPVNFAGGDVADGFPLLCNPVPGQPNAHNAANPGTLDAYLNPTCSASEALSAPGGILLQGGAGVAAAMRPGASVGPENSINWNLGFDFAPTDFLKGLDVGLTWYNLKIKGPITDNAHGATALGTNGDNDPAGKVCTAPTSGCVFLVRANPNLPITDPANATFMQIVNALFTNPRETLVAADLQNIQFVEDDAANNLGLLKIGGVDFNARYDFDLGDMGAWNVGVTGNYKLVNDSQAGAGTPVVSTFKGQNSGGRLSYRGRLGWAASGGEFEGLNVTGFVNYIPHGPILFGSRYVPPACYWQTGFSAGSCYPGSPYSDLGNIYPDDSPGLYTFDVSLGYETRTMPANTYLQNLNFQLTVNDILNKAPPFQHYNDGGRVAAAFVQTLSPLQRYINFAITKSW